MAAIDLGILYFTFALLPACIWCLPEAGIAILKFDEKTRARGFPKSLFKDATIAMTGKCKCEGDSCDKLKLSIRWKMKETQCAQDFVGVKDNYLDPIFEDDFLYPELRQNITVSCSSKMIFKDVSDQEEYYPTYIPTVTTQAPTKKKQKSTSVDEPKVKAESASSEKTTKAEEKSTAPPPSDTNNAPVDSANTAEGNKAGHPQEPPDAGASQLRRRRDETEEDANTTGTTTVKTTPAKTSAETSQVLHVKNQVAVTFHDAIYLLIVKVEPVQEKPNDPVPKFELDLTVKMKSKTGYLSAADWPLLPFYGVMSLVYLLFGIIWLVVSACQWRDLLRIQFWIGGVIALGMLEKAVFYSEYNDLNQTGIPKAGLVVFAELVSCLKRTLARILVIIVSMGFGIVKPRLGNVLHRVLGVGALYFILGSVEGGFRALSPKEDPSKQQLIANIPLAVLDAAICWWIFMSLVQTTRTLRIRRNLVKLSLYRHFTNTLIFAVLASVAYMIWSIKTHKFSECLSDWSELWLDEAFWHFLFSLLLLVIMILWRPTANNQRYAFTPLVDFGDDDDEDNITLSEAFEGMKMRPRQGNTPEVVVNGDRKSFRADDDLKWVEENIPTSAADAVLPSVLDSDEELMTTKFEMSKME